ncbi:MAG: hypothetical protein IPN76_30900 [Saprospiraceae bacterium]|nr:hypothetical protein [Saprospiraceae bacterium]
MENNLTIFGGLAGNEAPGYNMSLRNFTLNESILSGNIGAGGNADNSYHVVSNFSNGLNNTAVLDGFTITGGYGSDGGGMYNYASSPNVTNCIFSGNTAYNGGGMFNYASSAKVTNCIFSGNTASFGGGIYNHGSSSPTLTNCSFSGNSTDGGGGGMYNLVYSSPSLTNCSFSGNSAGGGGGGMYNYYFSSPSLTNCILWGNNSEIDSSFNSAPLVTYSIVQGGYTA